MIQNDENIDIKNKIIDKIIKNNNEKIFSISRKITDFKKAFEQKISSNIMMNSNKKQDIKKKVNIRIKKNKPEPIINNCTEKKFQLEMIIKEKKKKLMKIYFLYLIIFFTKIKSKQLLIMKN